MSTSAIENNAPNHLKLEIDNYVNINFTISIQDKDSAKAQGALYIFLIYEKILAKVARAILCINTTSVPSECLFSKADLIEKSLFINIKIKIILFVILITNNKNFFR